jgi:hypothetical protein
MSGNRMFSAGITPEGEIEGVQTTIVGGRPPARGRPIRNVPRGLEILLKKAAVDPEFKRRLLTDRSRAAARIALQLDPTEVEVLDALPPRNLLAMVDRTEVPDSQRRAFLGCVATVMLAALGAMEASAAEEIVVTGILPDRPGIKPILKWDGESGKAYTLYYSDDLKSWQYLASLPGVDGQMSYTDQAANWEGLKKRFYRIELQTLTFGITPDQPPKLEITYERVRGF